MPEENSAMTIRIRDLSHIYMQGTPSATTALRNISLDIASGCCTGISGRTGAGKSTLIQLLNGLSKPSSGCISVDGVDVTSGNLMEVRRRIGIVFQNPERQLFEETVYREIAFGLSRLGLSGAETDMRVREALGVVGLGEDLLERSPFRLSGGQKRRVAIAGVLAMRTDILILDEPAAGLDPQGRREILDSIAKLQRELGFTLLLVSNSLDDIARLVDRVVILKEGSVALEGTVREVLGNSRALESAGMLLPQITGFMMQLRKKIPELSECILTVEEARDELKRVLSVPAGGMRPYAE